MTAGSSFISIDGNTARAERKAVVDEFAHDCMELSEDGSSVIAVAVAVD
jgi:hypothetical protein